MTTRAKFRVDSVTRSKHWNGKDEIQTVKLSPVVGDNEENKKFYAATPCGSIELGTMNKAVGDQFELGKEYFVDFTPAD